MWYIYLLLNGFIDQLMDLKLKFMDLLKEHFHLVIEASINV